MRMACRAPAAIVLPLFLVASTGCDIVTADLKASETAEWRKTYELAPGGRVEVSNINGKIAVEPSTGNAVEIVAQKTAKASTSEAAKQALERIEIKDQASAEGIRVETKMSGASGWFQLGSTQVRYSVRVPAGAEVKFTTINGGVEVRGLTGRISAQATNGGVTGRDVSGTIEASTTNGGVDVELARVGDGGAKLECTNGGITLRLPPDAKASISASITNGGINATGLQLDITESTRRRLEGRLNGGGPSIHLEGTNGGIRIAAR
jgi:DUF4097 and DUF4098 domain-containing protein YvlB